MSDISSVPSRANSPVNYSPEQVLTARPYRFTWDPASRRPGPESVSGTTEGPGADDFAASPHPMAFLNHSSANLALGALPVEWSSSRTGFHAISTVLNNPHKRQAPPKAHSLLPPVPAASLPRVRRKDFDSYLKAIGPEWSRYEHNTKVGQEDEQQELEDTQWTPRNSIAGEEVPTPTRQSHTQGKYIPPLESVPQVFFQKKFDLSDPHTFATVTEQDAAAAMITPRDASFSDPFSLSHTLPLMEKFDHYSDTVEQHLVREISIRSTSFFAALTNLHDLQAESERCLSRIGKLRTQLTDVDNNSAKRGLEMVRRECKMASLAKIRSGVKMIGGVVEMTGVAKGLVNAGQWGEALGVIEELEKMWEANGSPPASADAQPKSSARVAPNGNGHAQTNGHHRATSPLPPMAEEDHEVEDQDPSPGQNKADKPIATPVHHVALSSLSAFSALPSHLRALTMEIAASLSSELVSVLRNDLDSRVNGDGRPNINADQGLRDRLKPLLLNLVRTKGLKEGILSWREVVLAEVRGIIKKVLPLLDSENDESRESSPSEARSGFASHMRSMSQPDFIVLIQKIYRRLLNGVEGLQVQGTIIVEVLAALGSQLQQKVTDIPALEEDLSDIVSSSAELASTEAAKVISYRAEQHAALELAEFLIFFNDSWAFVIKCETTCRRMIVGLRGTVVGQAKHFLQAFHQTRVSSSARLVEDEKWNPTEVTPALQHVANIVVESAVQDHKDLVIISEDAIFSPQVTTFPAHGASPTSAAAPAHPGVPAPSSASPLPAAANGAPTHTPASASTKHIRIEERPYFLVSATARVLEMLVEYLQVVVNLEMLTTDTMGRVIEYLKAFNSRTCQVVLGAGAMRSAGLKHITAKHLALASQSLSVISELIPYVRETFRRHLSQKQAVMLVEFDKLKRDYQEHQNEIHSKLVSIMGDRLKEHVKSLKTVDWSVPKEGGGINDYMDKLVNETVMLHKVLARYLSQPVVEYVMTQVFAAINHRLSEEYGLIELPHQDAKTRLLADATYLHQRLSALRNVTAPTGMLETIVADKYVPRAPGQPASPARPSGTSSPSLNSNSSSSAASGAQKQPAPPPMIRSNTLNANQRLKGLLSLSGRASTFGNSGSGAPKAASPSPPPPPLPSMSSSAGREKALPPPAPALEAERMMAESPPPVPPAADKPQSPVPASRNLARSVAAGVSDGSASASASASVSVLSNASALEMVVEPVTGEGMNGTGAEGTPVNGGDDAGGEGEGGERRGFKQVEIPPSPGPNPDVQGGSAS